MTGLELVKKHGYKTNAEAVQAMATAQTWVSKHPGKRRPVHVQRAVDLMIEMEQTSAAEHMRLRSQIVRMSRNPRFYVGAIVKGARFERARRWARRTFKLYLTPSQMAAHFGALVPDDFMRYWAGADPVVRVKAIDSLADTIVALYGLADGRNNPWATAGKEPAFVPWEVGKRIAWLVIAEKLKDKV